VTDVGFVHSQCLVMGGSSRSARDKKRRRIDSNASAAPVGALERAHARLEDGEKQRPVEPTVEEQETTQAVMDSFYDEYFDSALSDLPRRRAVAPGADCPPVVEQLPLEVHRNYALLRELEHQMQCTGHAGAYGHVCTSSHCVSRPPYS
jgi:hypothetical protein